MTKAASPIKKGAGMRLEHAVEEALAKLRTQRITDHRIHQARRALKKARAALRVLRPTLGDRAYRLENVTLRDAGRHLSPLRDARAALETFDKITARSEEQLRNFDLAPLHRILELDLSKVRRVVRQPSAPLDECVGLLESHRARMRHALCETDARDTSFKALKQIYRKGRKALAAAVDTETPEALHEWRKQVKYLLNAIDSVRGEWSQGVEKRLKRADRVADLLGEDHDLAVLSQIAADRGADVLSADATVALQAAIGQRRRKLQKRSIKLGQRIYALKPGRLLRLLLRDETSSS